MIREIHINKGSTQGIKKEHDHHKRRTYTPTERSNTTITNPRVQGIFHLCRGRRQDDLGEIVELSQGYVSVVVAAFALPHAGPLGLTQRLSSSPLSTFLLSRGLQSFH